MKRKILLKVIGVLISSFFIFNNLFSQSCDFTISTEIVNVTCPGNGSITVIVDTIGTDLSDFRYSLTSPDVNISRSTSNVFNGLSEGRYKVIVEAICGNTTVSDTLENNVVTSEYISPSVGMVQGNFTSSHQYGTVPSFNCASTGQVQLRMEGGTFPYIVEINRNGSLYRTDTFNERMYNGESATHYNYKDYYTIENLEPGSYTFHVTDGCGYSLPFVAGTISSLSQTYPVSRIYIYRDPGNINASNVFRFSLLQGISGDDNYYYYGYTQSQGTKSWWEYCLSVDGGNTYTDWKDVSRNGVVQDTIASLTSYCNLNGIQVKVRDKLCNSTYSKDFTLNIPNLNSAYQYTTDSSIVTPGTYDACGYVAEKSILYQHTSTYYQQFNSYKANQVSNSSADFYYSPPLTITVTNNTTGEVLSNTTQSSPSYNWRQNINLTPDLNGNSLNILVTDKNGCVISNNNHVINYQERTTTNGGNRVNTSWQINSAAQNNDNCGQTNRSITIVRQNPSPDYLDSTKVQLIQSPNNNKYNFTASYNASTNQWTITKDNPTNTADIYAGNPAANQLVLNAVDLPSGTYVFEITTQCRTETLNKNFNFPNFLSITEYPQYNLVQNCGTMDVIPVAGQVQANGANVTTYFQVISGEPGGYSTNSVTANNPIQLSIHGNYTIRMFSSINNSSTCGIYDTTINYSGASLEFDYLVAYVCTPDDTVAHINARGKTGKRPYTYTLSSDSQSSIIIASDTIGDFGNVRAMLNDVLYLKIEDACGASFITPVDIISLESTRKAWFENNNDKNLSICEGESVYIDGISLGEVEYSWTGPNGFSDTLQNTHFYIPRSQVQEGWYYLQVQNSFCPVVMDSIYLSIIEAPSVTILDNASICPSEQYTVNITAHGTGNITYTIANEVNSIINTKTIQNAVNGQTDTLTVSPLSTMKVWLQDIQDDRCIYNVPEDTITISIKSISSSCNISSPAQEVCYNGTAQFIASSTIGYPYTINWYSDSQLTTLIQSDVVNNSSENSIKTVNNLTTDTIFYITASNDQYCEYKPGVTVGSMNIQNGTTTINCGESIRFYDSGGPSGNYSSNEDLLMTFVSSSGDPVSISFDSFITEDPNFDKMYIYDGTDINSPVLASQLGGNLNNQLPGPFVSTGSSLTVLFVSNFNNNFEGWSAIVGVKNGSVPAIATVLDTLSVIIASSQALPIHFNSSTTLTANPQGGHNTYEYKWYTSPDSITWTLSPVNVQTYEVSNLTTPTYYKVEITDNSTEACSGTGESVVFLNVADINLTLDLTTTVEEVCPGNFTVTLTVRNSGLQPATNVLCELDVPLVLTNGSPRDISVLFPSIEPHRAESRDIILEADASIRINSPQVKAQIMSCDQGDNDIQTVYGDWDWNGDPRQKDEDTLTIHLKRVVTNNDIVTVSDTVCYGMDAHLSASSSFSYPQHYYWYTDSLGMNLIFEEEISSNSSILTIPALTQNTKRFVTMTSDDICPYTIINRNIEKILTMQDGIGEIEIDEVISFFDSGGPNGHYTENENYTYTIVSTSGDPITIKFNSFSTDDESNDYLYLYDGNSTASPLLTQPLTGDLDNIMPISFTTSGNSLTISFQSSQPAGFVGWYAEISTLQQLKAVYANIKEFADPSTITTISDSICPNGNAVLEAASTIAYPQTFNWYSDNTLTNLVYQEIVDGTILTKSTYNLQNQTTSATFYITVGNNILCNLSNEGLSGSAYVPATATLTINPLPEVNISGNQAICIGQSIPLSGTPSGGTWQSLNNNIATIDAAGQVTGLNSGNAEIRYIAASAAGCIDSTSIDISVNPLPLITVNDISICSGDIANLTTAVTSAAGETSYFYDDAAGTGLIVNPANVQGILATRTYYVKNVYDATSCESEIKSFKVIVNPLPSVTVQNISICSNENANLMDAIVSLVGDTLIFYSDNLGTIPVSDPTSVIVPANQTSYYVKSLNNTTNCESALSRFNVTINAAPTISLISDNTPLCKGQQASIRYNLGNATSATVSGLPSGVTYSVNSRILTISGVSSVIGDFEYTIQTTGQNSSCSAATTTGTFTINPNPVAQFNYTVDNVNQLIVDFTDESYVDAGYNITSWNWNFGDNNQTSIIQNPQDITYAQSGYYNVSLTVTTNAGCTASVTNQVHTSAMIQPDFSINNAAQCYDGNNIFTFQNNTIITGAPSEPVYTWNFGDNTPTTNEINPTHIYTQPGQYTVKLSVSILGTSTQVISKFVTVYPTPPINTHDIAICNGSNADLTTAVSSVAGTSEIYYSDALGLSTITTPSDVSNILTDSVFFVKHIYVNTGCESNIESFEVIVNEIPSVSVTNISACLSDNIIDLTTAITGQSQGSILKYYKDPLGTVPVISPEAVTQIAPLPYYVQAVNESTGCSGNLELITVLVSVNPYLTASNISICEGENANLLSAITDLHGTDIIFYSDIEGTNIIGQGVSGLTATTTFYAKATDTNIGCDGDIIPFNVIVNPLPQVTVHGTFEVCEGGNRRLIGLPITGSWTIQDTDIVSIINNDTFIGLAPGSTELTYTVQSAQGCTNSASITFTVNELPSISIQEAPSYALCNGTSRELSVNTNGRIIRWNNSNPAVATVNLRGVVQALSPGTTELYCVVENEYGCLDSTNLQITVNILPDVTAGNFVYCHGEDVLGYRFSGTTGTNNATYSWRRLYGNDFGLNTTSGYDILPGFTAENSGIYPLEALYEVTPIYTENGATCVGRSEDFLIIVNPMPVMAPVSDMIYCYGTEVNPYTFTGSVPDADYKWWRVGGDQIFELPEYGEDVMHGFTAITNGTLITANYKLTADFNFANKTCNNGDTLDFSITILPDVMVNITNGEQTICSGGSINEIIFSSNVADEDVTYEYEILSGQVPGLPLYGTDNIPSEILFNYGTSPVSALYKVTPTYSYNGLSCEGNSKTFSVTVIPEIYNETILPFELCAGENVPAYSLGTNPNISYSWTNEDGVYIGLPDSGNGHFPAFTAFNDSESPISTKYKVVYQQTINNVVCEKSTFVTITVNAMPTVEPITGIELCNNDPLTINFEGNAESYRWQFVNGHNIGLPLSGSGNITDQTVTNNTNAPVTVTYKVTPVNEQCSGDEHMFDITVYPTPIYTSEINAEDICSNDRFTYVLTSRTEDVSFSWSREANPDINGGATGAGNNEIIDEILINSSDVPVTITYNINLDMQACTTNTQTLSVIVYPAPVVDPVQNVEICSNNPLNINFSGNAETYSWERVSGYNIGLPIRGTGNITDQILTNTTNSAVTATYKVTPINGPCTGNEQLFDITVFPTPVYTGGLNAESICSNDRFTYVLTSRTEDVSFSWTRPSNPDINGGATGAGNNEIIDEILINSSNAPVTVTYNINLDMQACTTNTQTLSVMVYPTPVVDPVQNVEICSNNPLNINFSGNAETYSWERVSGYNIGLPIRGTGNITDQTAINNTNAPVTATYKVTPTNGPCTGNEDMFDITVFPTPVYTGGLNAESICSNDRFTYVLTSRTEDVSFSWTRPSNPDINGGATGAGNNEIIDEILINSSNAPVIVTYNINLDMQACTTNTQTLSVIVYPAPMVEPIENVEICNNDMININFSGNAETYSWERVSGYNIGLPLRGTGNITDQTAINNTNAPVTVTYKVTPLNGPCSGNEQMFDITVFPSPVYTSEINAEDICSNDRFTYVLTSRTENVSFSWTRPSNPDINGGATGAGNNEIIDEILINSSNVPVTVVYNINLSIESCSTNTQTLSVVVYPTPMVNPVENIDICTNNTLTINFTGNAETYSWERINGYNIGLPIRGTGDIIDQLVINNSSSPVTVTYKVTPVSGRCNGLEQIFDITVEPNPVLSSPVEAGSICSGEKFEYRISSRTENITFNWHREANPYINNGNESQGNSDLINETLTNSSDSPVEVRYAINMTIGSCSFEAEYITLIVNPSPQISINYMHSICPGVSSVIIPYTTNYAGEMQYSITFSSNAISAGFQNQYDFIALERNNIIIPAPTNINGGHYTGTITVKNEFCSNSYPFEINVTYGFKIIEQPLSQTNLCDEDSEILLSVTTDQENLTYQWYHNGVAISGANSHIYSAIYNSDMAGEYFVEITGSCATLRSNIVKVSGNPVFILEKWGNILLVDDPNHEFSAFQWYKNGTPVHTNGTSQYYGEEFGFNGTYYVRCYYPDNTYIESCPVELYRPISKIYEIYPNPANHGSSVTVEISEEGLQVEGTTIEVYDGAGKLVERVTATAHQTEIKAPLMPGSYVIRITNVNKDVVTKRLVVN